MSSFERNFLASKETFFLEKKSVIVGRVGLRPASLGFQLDLLAG
jgi:hypothetical protein